MAPIRQLSYLDVVLLFIGLWLLLKVIRILLRVPNTTRLKGPQSKSWILGFSSFMTTDDPSLAYEQWAEQYGDVFRVPVAIYFSITSRLGMGRTKLMVCDPKAIQHIYSKNSSGYVHSQSRKKELGAIVYTFLRWCRRRMADVNDRSERVFCAQMAKHTRGKYPTTDSLRSLY
jgi:hypothetical protein